MGGGEEAPPPLPAVQTFVWENLRLLVMVHNEQMYDIQTTLISSLTSSHEYFLNLPAVYRWKKTGRRSTQFKWLYIIYYILKSIRYYEICPIFIHSDRVSFIILSFWHITDPDISRSTRLQRSAVLSAYERIRVGIN